MVTRILSVMVLCVAASTFGCRKPKSTPRGPGLEPAAALPSPGPSEPSSLPVLDRSTELLPDVVAFSHDGALLAAAEDGNFSRIRVWDTTTGRPRLIWDRGDLGGSEAMAWHPRARKLAIDAGHYVLLFDFDAAGSEPRRVAAFDKGAVSGLTWIEGGDKLMDASRSGQAFVWDPERVRPWPLHPTTGSSASGIRARMCARAGQGRSSWAGSRGVRMAIGSRARRARWWALGRV